MESPNGKPCRQDATPKPTPHGVDKAICHVAGYSIPGTRHSLAFPLPGGPTSGCVPIGFIVIRAGSPILRNLSPSAGSMGFPKRSSLIFLLGWGRVFVSVSTSRWPKRSSGWQRFFLAFAFPAPLKAASTPRPGSPFAQSMVCHCRSMRASRPSDFANHQLTGPVRR